MLSFTDNRQDASFQAGHFNDFAQVALLRSALHKATQSKGPSGLYRDLQRGWRVTAPNLEDCGLLQFDYEGLNGDDGLLAETALWENGFNVRVDRETEQFVETPAALKGCPTELREEILRTLLDVLRRSLAIKVDVLGCTT